MSSFLERNHITKDFSQADVLELIEIKAEESQNLEFKNAKEFGKPGPLAWNKLSVMISAFANTIGGTILFGIETRKRKAVGFDFIDASTINEKEILYAVQSRLHRPVRGLQIKIIPIDNNLQTSVLAILIPESTIAPHMAYDNRFFKRYNYKEIVMEEHEVRLMYNKSTQTDIEFFGLVNTNGIPSLKDGFFEQVSFYPRIMLRNISSGIEHHYKVEIGIPSELFDDTFTSLKNYFSRYEGVFSVFSIPNNTPLFQEELAYITDFKFLVHKNNFAFFDKGKIRIKLFFSNGIKEHSFSLTDTFTYNGKMLKAEDFVQPRKHGEPDE